MLAQPFSSPGRNSSMNQSFFGRRSFHIMLVLTFLLPLIWAGTRRALQSNQNNVKEWLPDGFQETEDQRWFQAHFPHEQFALVSWEGCTLDDMRLELLARKLVPPPEAVLPPGPWYFKSVITGTRLVESMADRYPELSREEILERLEGSLIGDDHKKTCLVVTLSQTAKGKKLHNALDKIRSLAAECDIAPDSLRMGGPPVDNVAIDVEGERTLMRLAGLSAIVGLGVSWLCFRSIRLTAMVFSTALLSAGIGMAIVFYSGGTVDAILLSMPSLVYVLAISGAVHIVNYYHDAIRDHGLPLAPERALAHGWFPCTMAAITTALGLGSLATSHIIPITKFGVYSAIGVLTTLGMLFLVLPACLYLWPSRQFAEEAARAKADAEVDSVFVGFWRWLGQYVVQHNLAVAGVCLVVMGLFAAGLPHIKTSVKLMKLFSPGAQIIEDYAWLEEHLGPLVPMEIVIRVDNDENKMSFVERMRLAQAVEYTVESLHDVGGALSAATLAPDISPDTQRASILTKMAGIDRRRARDRVLSNRLEDHRDEFAEYLGYDEETNEELWRVSARVWALTDLDYGLFVDDLRAKVEPVLAAYREAGYKGIDATYTGLVPLVYKAQHELMTGLFNSLELAFLLIAIVMMIVLKSMSAGLLSMIPNVFPVVVIFGFMGWSGILVDVGTMMTASVALGVAVDDTVHYLFWFRDGLDQGRERKAAAIYAYERCAQAMSQTTLIAGLGLAAFAFSTFTPTQRFGIMMLALLLAALVGDLIFLPAILSSPIGRFFRFARRKPAGDTPAAPQHATPQTQHHTAARPSVGPGAHRHTRSDQPHHASSSSRGP